MNTPFLKEDGSPLIIAELGTGHRGDPERAGRLVEAAAEAGADCVKLQMVIADEILHPNCGEVPLPGGNIRLYETFRSLEVPQAFYAEVKAHVERLGLLFLCTPFGPESARLLRELNPSAVKIASPELNHTALLRAVAAWKLPTFLSSGVSTLADIEEALAILEAANPDFRESTCLLHCITAYPAPETEYNLRLLQSLSAIFGVPSGISDHSLDAELVPALAVRCGARAIEKHLCLSRSDPGLDDPVALPPQDFRRMALAVAEAARSPEESLSRLNAAYGEATIRAVLGDGIKRLAPSERANYGRTNRSLHALKDIPAGSVLEPGDFAPLRTEKILRPGLPPAWAERIVGRRTAARIPAGEGIRFEDLG